MLGSADVQTEQQDVNVVLSVRMIATLFDVHLAFICRGSARFALSSSTFPSPSSLAVYIVD